MVGMRKKTSSRAIREAQQAAQLPMVESETTMAGSGTPPTKAETDANAFAVRYLEDEQFASFFDSALINAADLEEERFAEAQKAHDEKMARIAARVGTATPFQRSVKASKAPAAKRASGAPRAGKGTLGAKAPQVLAVIRGAGKGGASKKEIITGAELEPNEYGPCIKALDGKVVMKGERVNARWHLA